MTPLGADIEQLRTKSQDYAVRYVEALEDDDYDLATQLTKEHLALIQSSNKASRISEINNLWETAVAIGDTHYWKKAVTLDTLANRLHELKAELSAEGEQK